LKHSICFNQLESSGRARGLGSMQRGEIVKNEGGNLLFLDSKRFEFSVV